MDNLELKYHVDRGRHPVHVKIEGMAAPAIDRKIEGKNRNLANCESKKNRKILVNPSSKHGHSNDGLQDGLRNPECKLDL